MLTLDILNGNHNYDIDEKIINGEIRTLTEEIENSNGFDPTVEFDPKKHLAFYQKKQEIRKHSLGDLGIEKTHCPVITDIAAVEPFPLFTEEAIEIMKWEVFLDPGIIRSCGRGVNFAKESSSRDFQVSGYVDKTKFTKAAVTHPETILIISEIMGLPLKIPHVFSMGSVNASLADRTSDGPSISNESKLKEALDAQNSNADSILSAVHWHYDSVPIVCVLMLEAPKDMIGGETCIKKGNEELVRIEGPRKGYASLLQGRVVKHIATKPLNNADRVSFVFSFIPEDPDIVDTTSALSERPLATPSYLHDTFYPNYVSSKLERIEQRFERFKNMLMQNYDKGEKFDQLKTIKFCQEIESYLQGIYVNFEAIDDAPYPPKLFSIPYADL